MTRSAGGLEPRKSLFDKGKPEVSTKLKSYSKEEIQLMKRSQLRELAQTVGVTTAGTDADVADRLISKLEDLRNDSDVMIVESFFDFAFNGFPRRTDYNAAQHRIKEYIFDFFDDVDVFVDVVGVHEGLEIVGLKGNTDYADRIRQKSPRAAR